MPGPRWRLASGRGSGITGPERGEGLCVECGPRPRPLLSPPRPGAPLESHPAPPLARGAPGRTPAPVASPVTRYAPPSYPPASVSPPRTVPSQQTPLWPGQSRSLCEGPSELWVEKPSPCPQVGLDRPLYFRDAQNTHNYQGSFFRGLTAYRTGGEGVE